MLVDRPALQGMPGLLLFGIPVRVEGLSATLALTSLRIVPDLVFCPFCSTQNPYFSRVFANGSPTFCKP